jgi:hypothetical protein
MLELKSPVVLKLWASLLVRVAVAGKSRVGGRRGWRSLWHGAPLAACRPIRSDLIRLYPRYVLTNIETCQAPTMIMNSLGHYLSLSAHEDE